jgi:hypothetical protein
MLFLRWKKLHTFIGGHQKLNYIHILKNITKTTISFSENIILFKELTLSALNGGRAYAPALSFNL